MATKQIVLNLDEELVEKSERILDGIGGLQIGVSIFLSRLIKENSFMFLFNENKVTYHFAETQRGDTGMITEKNKFDDGIYVTKRTKKPITKEMRDYVWKFFKQVRVSEGVINRNDVAKDIADKSGMNQGSAFIYIGILINLLDGNINTRNMKFEDLEQYVKYIKNECTERDFEKTLMSLEKSIPYWKEHFVSDFSYNVERLVKQYRKKE